MSRPEDAYRSALNKVTASDDWKARTRAAMEAASSPAAPRLQVVKNPRRAWKGVLAAAACLILIAIPVVKYGPMLGLDGFGASGGAAAPNMAAAYDAAGEGAEPRAAAPQAMAMAPDEESAAEKSQVTADTVTVPAVTAIEGLPEEGEPVDTVLTRVGEDEESVYYLTGSLEGVTALYEDGSSEPLADALESGRVTLADLQRLGVPLTAEPKEG